MSRRHQTEYNSEFKESAIKLSLEPEKPVAQTADDLGLKKSTLYTWIKKHGCPKALINRANNNEHIYDENKRLRKDLARVMQERGLLKKAAAYFVSHSQ
ncbi:MAG: transposase [Rickettsiales bacterium]|nr:transposase [Rickettsiales bacterium]